MKIYEVVQQIEEGPNDPHIFKAVFMAGGPGSGKSYVAGKMLGGTGLKTVNSDEIYEYLAMKQNMDLGDPEVVGSPEGQAIRNKAKELTPEYYPIYRDLALVTRKLKGKKAAIKVLDDYFLKNFS